MMVTTRIARLAGQWYEADPHRLREQVEGHREMYRFEVMHERAQEEVLIGALGRVCAVARARYWVLPVMGQGHFGDLPPES